MERTLVFVKPHIFKDFRDDDALKRVFEDIEHTFKFAGLKIVETFEFYIDEPVIRNFYAEHAGKSWFEEDLIAKMVAGKAVAYVIEGHNAVGVVRVLIGKTNPAEAASGTIRYRFGRHEKGPNNAVHASDSPEAFIREIEFLRNLKKM